MADREGSVVGWTTRDEHLVATLGKVCTSYEVKELDKHEALELFSQHAPREDYLELASHVIHYAKGLPLALAIIGSDLCGRTKLEWKSAIDKYEKIPKEDIQEILKVSYDGLEETEKETFLDIACFFKGWYMDYVVDILDACDLYPNFGIPILVNKSLITVDQNGTLSMHDMGKEVVRQESPEILGKCSELWYYVDALEVLTRRKELWFENLQRINFSECDSITNLPNFCAPNLEEVSRSYCKNLVEVHESFGFLDKLQEWRLKHCEKLQILPSKLMLKSRKYFNLEGYSSLEKFPNIHPIMKCLEIGENIGNLPNKECEGARGDILMDIGPSTRFSHQSSNNEGVLGLSMEKTKNEFESGMKGFHGDLNLSLSVPNDPELLPLLPLPYDSNMDYEVSNAVSDLGHLKDFHNDGRNLSLLANVSEAEKREPPLVTDTANVTHTSINDDTNFNMFPPTKQMRTS
nr:TMV resistance protein N-like [Quercus suber]